MSGERADHASKEGEAVGLPVLCSSTSGPAEPPCCREVHSICARHFRIACHANDSGTVEQEHIRAVLRGLVRASARSSTSTTKSKPLSGRAVPSARDPTITTR